MASIRPFRIVIPGGSGQVGSILARHFHEQGHHVTVLSRHKRRAEWKTVFWDGLEFGEWVKCIDGADLVINLAGKNVNCRYNAANRREIKNSRTISTGLVGRAIAQAAQPPRMWFNASTCTIYRHALDRVMDEAHGEIGGDESGVPSSWAFSIDVATSWERALFAANTPHTRRVALRSSMIMSPDSGGIFDTLLRMVRFGLGGTLGPGNQYVSWIHEFDFVRAIEFLMAHEELDGPVNISSPCPVPNRFFMRCLRHAWCTTYVGLPAPTWALSVGAVLLRTETELLLKSRRVIPAKLLNSGFEVHFPSWRSASQDLVSRWRELRADKQFSAAAL
jgi:uncharacterized protein (TIGR01777 family)